MSIDMTQPASLVLFDLDATLFDLRHANRSALETLQAECPDLAGAPIEDLEAEAYRILNSTHERVLAGEMTPEAARLDRVRQLLAWCGAPGVEDDRIESIAGRYGRVYTGSRRAIDGARELLGRLRAHARIGVVTNNFVRRQESKLADCGLAGLVDFMVTSEDAGCAKPAPEIFRRALERGEAPPSRAVMVGDSWEIDIVGAARAGIRPVWFNPAGVPAPEAEAVDAGAVSELRSFRPVEAACRLILGA